MKVTVNLSEEEVSYLKNQYGTCVAGIHQLIMKAEKCLVLSPFVLERLSEASEKTDLSVSSYASTVLENHLDLEDALGDSW